MFSGNYLLGGSGKMKTGLQIYFTANIIKRYFFIYIKTEKVYRVHIKMNKQSETLYSNISTL